MLTNILKDTVFLLFIVGLVFLYMIYEAMEAAGGIISCCVKWDGVRSHPKN